MKATGLAQLVGINLRAARKSRNHSRYEFAVRANISLHVITSLETGHYNPSLQMIEKLAKALDVDPVFLFCGESPPGGPWFPARNFGICAICGERYIPGDRISSVSDTTWACYRPHS